RNATESLLYYIHFYGHASIVLLDPLEEQEQRDAEQREEGHHAEVIHIGHQGGLLLHAAVEHAHSFVMGGDHVDALGEELCLQAAHQRSGGGVACAGISRQIILMSLS